MPAANSRFTGKSGSSGRKAARSKPVSGAKRFAGPDCQNCRRFELAEREPFVGPEVVAEFLDIEPETAARYARLGYLPAHPLHVVGKRMYWRFLLSEVQAAMVARTNTYKEPQQRSSRSG